MQLNSKGKLAMFYKWLTPEDQELPHDFCTFFWSLVGRTLALVFFGGLFLFCVIYILVTGVLFVSRWAWAHIGLVLYILGVLLVVAIGIWLSGRKKKIKIGILEEIKTVIGGKVDAIKNRYCPRIDWK